MESEAKIIIAFLFNRSGKNALKDAEIYLPLSMELGWFSIKEAQDFLAYSLAHGLLKKKEGALHPSFSVEKTTIPLGFTPSKKIFSAEKTQEQQEDVLHQLIDQIATQTNREYQELLKETTALEKEKNILPEVAALSIARRYNADVTSWYDAVEQLVLKKEHDDGKQ